MIKKIKTTIRSIRNHTIIRSQIHVDLTPLKAVKMESYNELLGKYHIQRWYDKKFKVSVFEIPLEKNNEGVPIEKVVLLSQTLLAIHLNILTSTELDYGLKNMLLDLNGTAKPVTNKK